MNRTKRLALSYIIFVFLLGCIPSQGNKNLRFVELAHGIAEVSGTVLGKSDSSPSGNTVNHTNFKIVKTVDTLPAEIGLVFGIEFRIDSNDDEVELERLWTFPKPIIDQNGRRFGHLRRLGNIATNQWQWMGYTLEKEFEIVKGRWILQYFYKGEEIYRRDFYLK